MIFRVGYGRVYSRVGVGKKEGRETGYEGREKEEKEEREGRREGDEETRMSVGEKL